MEFRKSQRKRPFFVLLAGFTFIFLPVFNILQAYISHKSKISFFQIDVILYYFPFHVPFLLLITSPIVGIGILRIKKWGWYSFLAYCGIVFLYNLTQLLKHPSAFEAGIFFRSALCIIGLWYFLGKEIRMPYLDIVKRGWRGRKREEIKIASNLSISGKTYSTTTADISEIGSLFEFDNSIPVSLGDPVQIKWTLNGENQNLQGLIVRIEDNLLGVKFQSIPKNEKRILHNFLK